MSHYNLCIKDLYLIFLTIIIFYLLYCNICSKKEGFAASDDIKAAIGEVYNADIEAIRNLSSIAKQLMTTQNLTIPSDLTVPGKINTTGPLKIGSWTIRDYKGRLEFIKDGVQYNDDYNAIAKDKGFLSMSDSGDIWLQKTSGYGWVGDTKLNISGGTITGPLTVNGTLNVKGTHIADGQLNMNNLLNMNGKIAMNDNAIMIRSVGDNNHYIKFSSVYDGPEISACGAVNITRGCGAATAPIIRMGDWTIQNVDDQGGSLRFNKDNPANPRYYQFFGGSKNYYVSR